ncbi:MAG: hypothetical protein QNI84_07965 [Henriciella sp.]|nr:hypothetical protein [Henriciella sp.]
MAETIVAYSNITVQVGKKQVQIPIGDPVTAKKLGEGKVGAARFEKYKRLGWIGPKVEPKPSSLGSSVTVVEALRKELADLQALNASMAAANTNAGEVAKMQVARDDAFKQVAALQQQLAGLKAEAAKAVELGRQRDTAQAEAKALGEELATLKTDAEKTAKATAEADEQVKTLQGQVTALTEERNQLGTDLEALKTEYESLEASAAEMKELNQRAGVTITDQENQIAALQKQLTEAGVSQETPEPAADPAGEQA